MTQQIFNNIRRNQRNTRTDLDIYLIFIYLHVYDTESLFQRAMYSNFHVDALAALDGPKSRLLLLLLLFDTAAGTAGGPALEEEVVSSVFVVPVVSMDATAVPVLVIVVLRISFSYNSCNTNLA